MALFLSSCLTTEVSAPAGQKVTLASDGAFCKEKIRKRVWFALWGVYPISQNKTSELLKGIKEPVKIKTYFSWLDVVIALFTGGFSIVPKTVAIYICKN